MKNYYFVLILLFSCQNFPNDPKNTMEQVTNGVLRAGFSENPPWVIKTEEGAGGIEAEIIKQFALEHKAKVIWLPGTEEVLFEKLEKNELDVVIAGITDKTPWKSKKISLTRPYYEDGKKKHVIALEQGENRFQVALETFMHKHPVQKPSVK